MQTVETMTVICAFREKKRGKRQGGDEKRISPVKECQTHENYLVRLKNEGGKAGKRKKKRKRGTASPGLLSNGNRT